MPLVLRLNLLSQRFDALLIACALHLKTVASGFDDNPCRAFLACRGPTAHFHVRLSFASGVACAYGQEGKTVFSYA